MGIKIGHASSDECGNYSCGKAGDLTGKEVCIRDWYNRPWNVVLVHPDCNIREQMALAMEDACRNDHIGYDQDATSNNDAGRNSLFKEARKVNFLLKNIKNDCETDCSNLVAACCNAAGLAVSESIYTGNERKALEALGFKSYTDKKYLNSPDYLPRGSVLLYEGHHTAILIENGCKFVDANIKVDLKPITITGTVVVVGTSSLSGRDYPSTNNSISKVKKTFAKGTKLKVIGKLKMDETMWFKTSDNLWVSSKYLTGMLSEPTCGNKLWIVEPGYTYSVNMIKTFNGKDYWLDKEGWIVTSDRLNKDGSLKK